MSKKKASLGMALLAVLLVGQGCFSKPASQVDSNANGNTTGGAVNITPPSANTNAGEKAVSIDSVAVQGFEFAPRALTIKKGTTVTWTNRDTVGHTVTSDSGSELNSPLLTNGKSYSHTFNTVGTFNYHCAPHPQMKGSVVVTE